MYTRMRSAQMLTAKGHKLLLYNESDTLIICMKSTS